MFDARASARRLMVRHLPRGFMDSMLEVSGVENHTCGQEPPNGDLGLTLFFEVLLSPSASPALLDVQS